MTKTFSMPTFEDIAARAKEREKSDLFGFEVTDLLEFLPFEYATSFLKEGSTKESWETGLKPLDRKVVLDVMEGYIAFAWGKANDCRGLSAQRSVMHYIAWTFLAGDRELSDWCADEANYRHYGKEILRKICEHYGWDWKKLDNGCWTNDEGGVSDPIPDFV